MLKHFTLLLSIFSLWKDILVCLLCSFSVSIYIGYPISRPDQTLPSGNRHRIVLVLSPVIRSCTASITFILP